VDGLIIPWLQVRVLLGPVPCFSGCMSLFFGESNVVGESESSAFARTGSQRDARFCIPLLILLRALPQCPWQLMASFWPVQYAPRSNRFAAPVARVSRRGCRPARQSGRVIFHLFPALSLA